MNGNQTTIEIIFMTDARAKYIEAVFVNWPEDWDSQKEQVTRAVKMVGETKPEDLKYLAWREKE